MHRTALCLLIALVLAFSLAACGGSPSSADGAGSGAASGETLPFENSLVQKSAALTRLMGELAADPSYSLLMSGTPELQEIIREMAAVGYAAPVSATILPLPRDLATTMLEEVDELGGEVNLGDSASQVVNRRLATAAANVVAGQRGANYLAATSILSVNDSYQLAPGLEGGALVILFYDGDYCSVTGFVPGQENTMMAFSSFAPAGEVGDETAVNQMITYLRLYGAEIADPLRFSGAELAALLE